MLEPTIKTGKTDMKSLIRDAQILFRDAAAATGTKADELRARGQTLLDTAVEKAQGAQTAALATGKEFAASADDYVHVNPWKAIALSAGVGLLAGIIIARSTSRDY